VDVIAVGATLRYPSSGRISLGRDASYAASIKDLVGQWLIGTLHLPFLNNPECLYDCSDCFKSGQSPVGDSWVVTQ